MYCISVLLVLAAAHCLFCIELDQPPVMAVKPGEMFTIACKITGYSASGGGYTNWIRHSSGKPMEWIGWFHTSSSNGVKDSLKNKISFSSESSSNAVILTGKSFNTEDTAVYYCARNDRWSGGFFDYWGKGTTVTVTSAQQSAPKSIFGMSQCTSDSDGFVTVGCLARGFSPADSLTFKWKDTNKDLSEFGQYPAFGRDGDYTKISHMRIRKSDWVPQNPYTCQATNSKGSLEVKVEVRATPAAPPTAPPPAPPTAPPPAPPSGPCTLTLKPPLQREIFVHNKVVLEAVVSGDIKDAVSCTVNNAERQKVDFSQSTKKFNVTVDTRKWFNGEKVTCTIHDINNKEIKEEISFKKGDGKTPSVTIYKPDTIYTNHVSHVCEVTSPNLGDVYIMWKLGDEPYIEGTTSAPIHQKNSKSVLSILTVSKKDYENLKTIITCAVKHANMKNTSAPLQVSTSKSEPPEPENGCALDCNKDVEEEDEFRSLWSTATSFIFLFLFSLTYSAVLSFFKVKQ